MNPKSLLWVLFLLGIAPGCRHQHARDPGHGFYPSYSRGVVDAHVLDGFKARKAAVDEVLLALGEPEDYSPTCLTYRWVMTIESHVLVPTLGTGGIPESVAREINTVSIFLDSARRVERWTLTKSDGGSK